MSHQTLLSGTLPTSRIICGLWQLAGGHDTDVNINSAAVEVNELVKNGLTTFDMSDHYGPAEEVVGIFNQSFPSQAKQSFTKWCPKPGPTSFETAEAAVDLALKRMGQKRIDLLQFHIWKYTHPSYIENILHLHTLQQRGKILLLGLTNTSLPHLRLIHSLGVPISSTQVSCSILDRRVESTGMGKWCAENGVGVLAYGVLLGGWLSEKWVGVEDPGEGGNVSLRKYKRFIDAAGGWEPFQTLLQTLSLIATKHSTTIPTISAAYVLSLPYITSIILGTRLTPASTTQVLSNLSALDITLDAEDLAAIKKVQEGLKVIPGECGDEYRYPPFLTPTGGLVRDVEEEGRLERVEKAVAEGRRVEVSSGSPYEPIVGYCRANRIGNILNVAGTTSAPHPVLKSPIGGSSAFLQTVHIMDTIERALLSLGGSWRDVVRTRILLKDEKDWEEVCRYHGKVFARAGVRPVNTTIGGARLVDERMLVEIEMYAVVGAGEKEVLRI